MFLQLPYYIIFKYTCSSDEKKAKAQLDVQMGRFYQINQSASIESWPLWHQEQEALTSDVDEDIEIDLHRRDILAPPESSLSKRRLLVKVASPSTNPVDYKIPETGGILTKVM